MKKILATVLALTMIVGMSLTIFAAKVTEEGTVNVGDTVEIPVSVAYSDADATDTATIVYSIDVAWEDMTFTYQASGNRYIWNPATFQYDAVAESVSGSGWNKTTADITVTNRSNAAVTVSATIDDAAGFTVTESDVAESAVGGDKDNPPQAVITVTAPASVSNNASPVVTLTIA